MNPALLIRAGLAIGALVGAAFLGRRAIDKSVKTHVSAATEQAVQMAEAELERSVKAVLTERVAVFLRALAWKFLLLGAVCAAYGLDLLTLSGLRFSILTLGVGFLAYDLRSALPKILPALRYARQHSFRPRSIITEAVAAAAFEQAYDKAAARLGNKEGRHWIALSSFNPHDLSNEVAEAVAEVARNTSYEKVWPRVLMFFAITLLLSGFYSTIAWLAVQL